MTAQDDNSVNLNYPVQTDNSGSSPSAITQPVSTPTPDPATSTPQPAPLQSIDDLDPNRGQQISGPTFETSDTSPSMTPLPENNSGAMSDLMQSSTTMPVSDPMTMPTPTLTPDPITTEPTIEPEKKEEEMEKPSVEEPKEEEKKEDEKEDKKESPLQALARKLSELKSELIEETPEKEEPKKEDIPLDGPETPAVPGDVPMPLADQPSTGTDMPMETPLSMPMSTPATDQTPSHIDTSINPGGSLDVPLSEPMKSDTILDVPLSTPSVSEMSTPDPMIETPNPEETVESPTLDLGDPGNSQPPISASPDVPDASVAAQADTLVSPTLEEVKTEESVPVDPLEEFQSEQATTPSEASPTVATPLETPPTVDSMVGESSVTMPSNVIDENAKDSVSTESIDAGATVGGKYPLNINKILDLAIERNASDVHISVGYPVMLRIDGTLIELHQQIVSAENSEELIFPLLTEQKKELLEVNREVDFAHTHRHGGEARFRINAFYSRENLAAALRLIPTRIRTIEELMLPGIYAQFANMKQGLILVTGPTGHGKSTTLAAILQHINTNRSAHMITIEDPIEYIFPKAKAVVDQREMHDDTHSWAVALKSALRQDPDVILVGEMRDYETIAATITLAETGHLVFATLHTNSAAQTIDRIIDVFPENQQAQVRAQLSNILEAVIAQRLIPIDGGGRRAVSEIMLGTSAVKNLIREGKSHQIDNVIRTSADVGMVSLEHALVKLVREGLITMDKAQDYAVHPEEVVRLLKS